MNQLKEEIKVGKYSCTCFFVVLKVLKIDVMLLFDVTALQEAQQSLGSFNEHYEELQRRDRTLRQEDSKLRHEKVRACVWVCVWMCTV